MPKLEATVGQLMAQERAASTIEQNSVRKEEEVTLQLSDAESVEEDLKTKPSTSADADDIVSKQTKTVSQLKEEVKELGKQAAKAKSTREALQHKLDTQLNKLSDEQIEQHRSHSGASKKREGFEETVKEAMAKENAKLDAEAKAAPKAAPKAAKAAPKAVTKAAKAVPKPAAKPAVAKVSHSHDLPYLPIDARISLVGSVRVSDHALPRIITGGEADCAQEGAGAGRDSGGPERACADRCAAAAHAFRHQGGQAVAEPRGGGQGEADRRLARRGLGDARAHRRRHCGAGRGCHG
jgi:hypothetical protein